MIAAIKSGAGHPVRRRQEPVQKPPQVLLKQRLEFVGRSIIVDASRRADVGAERVYLLVLRPLLVELRIVDIELRFLRAPVNVHLGLRLPRRTDRVLVLPLGSRQIPLSVGLRTPSGSGVPIHAQSMTMAILQAAGRGRASLTNSCGDFVASMGMRAAGSSQAIDLSCSRSQNADASPAPRSARAPSCAQPPRRSGEENPHHRHLLAAALPRTVFTPRLRHPLHHSPNSQWKHTQPFGRGAIVSGCMQRATHEIIDGPGPAAPQCVALPCARHRKCDNMSGVEVAREVLWQASTVSAVENGCRGQKRPEKSLRGKSQLGSIAEPSGSRRPDGRDWSDSLGFLTDLTGHDRRFQFTLDFPHCGRCRRPPGCSKAAPDSVDWPSA